MSQEKKQSVGAFWVRSSKNGGDDYMNGSIEIDGVKHEFVVFKNGFKTEDKHPDWKVYASEPRAQEAKPVAPADHRAPAQTPVGAPVPQRGAPAPVQRQAPPRREAPPQRRQPEPVDDFGDDDAPF